MELRTSAPLRCSRLVQQPSYEAGVPVSAEDLERYETEIDRDVIKMFSYVVETERRFYLANSVDMNLRTDDDRTYFELEMHDAWVWDMYRPGPARFVSSVRVVTFRDVNVEEIRREE